MKTAVKEAAENLFTTNLEIIHSKVRGTGSYEKKKFKRKSYLLAGN